MKPPFLDAIPIINQIEEAGFEAYFVGGSVRDFLLNRPIDDVDIATSATPEEVKAIFPKTIDVGIEHGTVVVLHKGVPYEVTTFRTESEYDDFRRPNDVTFVRSLKEDLERRDFTMNAIAMDKNGEIIDPFHGQESLNKRVITTVGDAGQRFHEDALRMMRAVRFVSQLSFDIDASTLSALKEHGKLLEHIAVERIAVEFEKLLLGPDRQRALKLLLETEIYRYLPGFSNFHHELASFSQETIASTFSIDELWVLLLYYFQSDEKNAEEFLRKWKQPIKRIKRVKKGLYWLYKRLNQSWTKEMLYFAQEEMAISTEKIYNHLLGKAPNEQLVQLKELLAHLPIKTRKDLEVTGKDLMEWYNKEGGPWIEEKLREIENAVIDMKIHNCKESIREWLFSCNQH